MIVRIVLAALKARAIRSVCASVVPKERRGEVPLRALCWAQAPTVDERDRATGTTTALVT